MFYVQGLRTKKSKIILLFYFIILFYFPTKWKKSNFKVGSVFSRPEFESRFIKRDKLILIITNLDDIDWDVVGGADIYRAQEVGGYDEFLQDFAKQVTNTTFRGCIFTRIPPSPRVGLMNFW